VTTHLRARGVQAGAFLALVAGALVVSPSVALAAQPTVSVDSVSSTSLPSGGTTTLKYTVTNNNLPGSPTAVQVKVSGAGCNGDGCSPIAQIPPQGSQSFAAQLTAPQVDSGQTKVITVQITATVGADRGTATTQLTVQGPDKPRTVRQISGRVKDGDGKPVAAADVGLRDSAGRNYKTTSNGDGGYVFTSSEENPIGTGSIVVGAVKQGFKPATVTVQGGADKSINVPLTLTSLTTTPSASPSASVSPSASAEPSEQATEDATDAPTDTPAAAATDPAAATGSDSGSSSLLFIVLGGLLVAAGIGAIVLVLMRRKDSGGDGDDPDGPTRPAGVVPPGQGRFADATRVAAPLGGRSNDHTMVAAAPSLSDAPTMLQRAVPAEDEFPDPYGAPAVAPGTFSGPGGWGTAHAAVAGAYGAAPAQQGGGTYGGGQYGAPVPTQGGGYEAAPYGGDGYGAYAGGQYGGDQPQPFDEPTGMYRPEPDGYDEDPGGYGRPGTRDYDDGYDYPSAGHAHPSSGGAYQSGGYAGQGDADRGGYGSWDSPGGGIDSDNGYAPPGGASGTYGAGGTYGSGPGNGERGGYDQRGTYGRPDDGYGPAGTGHPGGDRGGYYGGAEDENGTRHGGQSGQQPPESPRPGQRRSLDWMDD
jgi:hypothetical protein